MYPAVAAAILGQALLHGRPVLLVYALVMMALQYAFVRLHEEPLLRRRFGEQYDDDYRREVSRWRPRVRPVARYAAATGMTAVSPGCSREARSG
jgi:protein-S-isoprenylcysteine O-methyltransferase Ste14